MMAGRKLYWRALFVGLAAAVSLQADDVPAVVPPLNADASQEYFAGKIVWANLYTTDVAAATKFYTQLFGWTAQSVPGRGPRSILSLNGRPIAGIVTRSARMQDLAHGRWVPFASVPNVAAALSAAAADGGRTLHAAHSVPDRGEQGVFEDAEGALFGVVHSSSGDPGEYLAEPGEWVWAELFARDTDAEAKFYADVAGYEAVPDRRTADPNRIVLVSGSYSRASIVPVPDRPRAHPAWLLFVRVQDVKAAADRAAALGGRVIIAPGLSPLHHEQAIVADPTGGAVGLVELPAAEGSR